jgi:hypothetical protein
VQHGIVTGPVQGGRLTLRVHLLTRRRYIGRVARAGTTWRERIGRAGAVVVPSPASLNRAAALAAAVAILCLPALWNGLPFVYDDVGGYLERWPTGTLGDGRSAVYGALLWATASSFWVPVVLLQSAATVWVIDRTLAAHRLAGSPWRVTAAVALLAATTGIAYFVSLVMPDGWAAPAVLALHLIAWHADRLTRGERALMMAIVTFAGAAHMAILGLLAGLSLLYVAAWLWRRQLGAEPSGVVGATVAVWSGLGLLIIVNAGVAGELALTPGGRIFLFGRLVQSGIVSDVLAQECPRPGWRLCAFKDAMPETADDMLWDTESPLHRIGGWDDAQAQAEIAEITTHSFRSHPVDHLTSAVAETASQLVNVGIADALVPLTYWHAPWAMTEYAPWLAARYDRSRQGQEKIDVAGWSRFIVTPVSLAGTFALPGCAVMLWRRHRRRAAMLPAMVFLALVGNAFLCGFFSGSVDRYQARVAWLGPLAVGAALMTMRARRESATRPGDGAGIC